MKAKNPSNYWHWAAVSLLVLWASDATAFETYQAGCVDCHPGFEGGFGATLHDMHLTMTNDCNLCHVVPGDNPNIGIQDPAVDRGCVGCHGRFEDIGSDTLSDGLGAGLTQHHTNAGIDQCTVCHSNADPANYTPVGEDVLPPFYVSELAAENDPCLDFLDNDGDLLYDVEEDPDCSGNEAPIADPNGPYTSVVGIAVLFDGTGSTDNDGTIVAYDWDFGDGNTGTGPSPSHTYAAAGDYAVMLTVTDDGGLTNSATTSAAIEGMTANDPPVADAGGPYTGSPGQEVQFDGSGSFDPDGTIFAYLWDFGDGNVSLDMSPSHTYGAVGTYTVTLTVADNDGTLTSDTTTVEITDDVPPPPTGNAWTLRVPSSMSPGEIEFQIEIEDFGGILWFDERYLDGQSAFGIGQESGDVIFWMDSLGALFYGMVDHGAGTLMGIVFDFRGDRSHDTIFFGEQL